MSDRSQDLRPTDDPVVASNIARLAINATAELIEQLERAVASCYDRAPRSADHLGDLASEIARLVLDWITRWPT